MRDHDYSIFLVTIYGLPATLTRKLEAESWSDDIGNPCKCLYGWYIPGIYLVYTTYMTKLDLGQVYISGIYIHLSYDMVCQCHLTGICRLAPGIYHHRTMCWQRRAYPAPPGRAVWIQSPPTPTHKTCLLSAVDDLK